MKRIIVTCLLAATVGGCGLKDARTLTTIFHGIEAISELDRGVKQDKMLDRMIKLEEDRQTTNDKPADK